MHDFELCFLSSIDARELRNAMKSLGFKMSKESMEQMIGVSLGDDLCEQNKNSSLSLWIWGLSHNRRI